LEVSNSLIDIIIEGILEKKGQEIVCIDMTEIKNCMCDSFVICHGDSNTHVRAIVESVEKETVQKLRIRPKSIEGMENGLWALLDYGDIVVHVFQQPVRHLYKLEDLWGDGRITQVEQNHRLKL
jgi:ribosome-associated protein